MTSGKTRICRACHFPLRRGRVPIIWPENPHPDMKRVAAVYCSVKCMESDTGIILPEPMRSIQIAAESVA